MLKNGPVIVLDFGSQFTQLIVRRLRELGYFSQVLPFNSSLQQLADLHPQAIILSGGPYSVYEAKAPSIDIVRLEQLAPLLGICYGMQLIAHQKGGVVESSPVREYGRTQIQWTASDLTSLIQQEVWMSHGDIVKSAPPGFRVTAVTHNGLPAAMESSRIWALQFHPEVAHTVQGTELLKNFLQKAQVQPNWGAQEMLENLINELRVQVPQGRVLCALSGGVDSSVTAQLLVKALGADRVSCVFINNGLLRLNEFESVMSMYRELGLPVRGVDATTTFLTALSNVSDPEQKRKVIGRVFIEVFESLIPELGNVQFLAQGTLYPDVVESVTPYGGPSQAIKSHHNVGGLPEKMKLKIVEPLRWLFKDEVRVLGAQLGLPAEMVNRHPFPGPGLAIRVMGAITPSDLDILRQVDAIFIQSLKQHSLYEKIWQAFCVLLPVQTVGVQGDGRTYEKVIALRAVTSSDGMTADWYDFEPRYLRQLSNEITNQVKGINRVVYDVTSKPPATIEWE